MRVLLVLLSVHGCVCQQSPCNPVTGVNHGLNTFAENKLKVEETGGFLGPVSTIFFENACYFLVITCAL